VFITISGAAQQYHKGVARRVPTLFARIALRLTAESKPPA